jgi:uncharacterized protein YukE
MSVDKIYQVGRELAQLLDDTNRRLKQGFKELSEQEDALRSDWDDEMGREFRAKWKPLAEDMARYVDKVGPDYLEDLMARLNQLQRYLYGSRY